MKFIKNPNGGIEIQANAEEGLSLIMYAEEWASIISEDTKHEAFWKRMSDKLGEAVDTLDEDGPQHFEFSFDFPEDETGDEA